MNEIKRGSGDDILCFFMVVMEVLSEEMIHELSEKNDKRQLPEHLGAREILINKSSSKKKNTTNQKQQNKTKNS